MILGKSFEGKFLMTVDALHANLGEFFKPLSSCVFSAISNFCCFSSRFVNFVSGMNLVGIFSPSRSHFSANFLSGFLYIPMIFDASKFTKALFIFRSPSGNSSSCSNGVFCWMLKLVSFFCGAIHFWMVSSIAFSCRRLFSRIFAIVSSAIRPTFFFGHGAILT